MSGDSGIREFAAPLLAATLIWFLACSETIPVEPNPAMEEIYRLSDLRGQIETVIEYIDGALEPHRATFTAEQFEVAEELVKKQFAAEKLEQETLERLTAQSSPEFLDETLAWLRTPIVAKVMQAKSATWSPKGMAGMKSVVDQRQKNPPSSKLFELIERYDQAASQSEVAQDTIQLSGLAVAVMADSLRPAPEQQGITALQASMNARRNLIKPFFKEMSIVTSLVYFQDLSEEEIEAFVTFSESEAGKWYYETTSSAFLETLQEVAENLGAIFVAVLQAQPSS
jgi:hypothetical protein